MQGSRGGRRSAVRSGLLHGPLDCSRQRVRCPRRGAPRAEVRARRPDRRLLRRVCGLRRLPARRERAARGRAARARPRAAGRRARPRVSARGRSRWRCRSCPRSRWPSQRPHAVAGVLTGGGAGKASAASCCPGSCPLPPHRSTQALAASALGALDDYGTAALGLRARRSGRARGHRRARGARRRRIRMGALGQRGAGARRAARGRDPPAGGRPARR